MKTRVHRVNLAKIVARAVIVGPEETVAVVKAADAVMDLAAAAAVVAVIAIVDQDETAEIADRVVNAQKAEKAETQISFLLS